MGVQFGLALSSACQRQAVDQRLAQCSKRGVCTTLNLNDAPAIFEQLRDTAKEGGLANPWFANQ